MTLLYSSAAVRKAVVQLLSDPNDRRVAVSAFVGDGAEAFLRYPKGILLVCWPNPTGTNPRAVRDLLRKGVDVRFSDSLHMKVYWSSLRGTIITSANLSTNALGAGGLKEVGVKLPPGTFDIERVLSSLRMRHVKGTELDRLDRERDKYLVRNQTPVPVVQRRDSFRDWYKSPMRKRWLLGFWSDPNFTVAKSTIDLLKAEEGVKSAHLYLAAKKGRVQENQWLVFSKVSTNRARMTQWMYSDHVIRVPRWDQKAYNPDYPYQVVQVRSPKFYPIPPFQIDARFRSALSAAVREVGEDYLDRLVTLRPGAKLLASLYSHYEKPR
jgi:hypothetical protein